MSRRVSNNTWAVNATVAWAAVVVLAAPGCSFLFSEGAPENHRGVESFTCAESYVPPILDTVASGLLGLEAIGTASTKSSKIAMTDLPDQPAERHTLNVDIGVQAAFATVAAAAAIYGYHAVGDCREARDVRLALIGRVRLLPPPYGVPPIGEPPPLWPPRLFVPAPSMPQTPATPATPSP